ncbi:MAG: hypothetical protein ACRYGR_04715 [Janthinobacterium lividum]
MKNYELLKQLILKSPFWVWIAFIYLIFIGIKLSRPHIIYLPKLTLITLLLFVLNYFSSFSSVISYLWIYCLAISCGAGLGIWTTYKMPLKILRNKSGLEVPGTYFPLILFMAFFVFKYTFGYGHATNPRFFNQYAFVEILINGGFSGYFFGRLIYFIYFYKKL